MAISPGGRPADDSPFSTSRTSNWVARAGGLPKYIREVAHALIRSGHSESTAIASAVVAMKRWAAGGDHVRPQVQAAAAAALAEWEAKRGSAHVGKNVRKRDFSTDQRQKLASKGDAMPDGSFPIKSVEDLHNAVKLCGHAKDPAAARAFIIRTAKKRGWTNELPSSWNVSKAVRLDDAEFFDLVRELREDEKEIAKHEGFTLTAEISKVDKKKQMVFGWLSVYKNKDGQQVEDHQGDIIKSQEDLEDSAYHFVLHSRDGGEMHMRKGVSKMVESMVFTPEKIQKLGLPEGSLPIGWWGGFKIVDPKVWADVEKGKYRMFSVHGRGVREAL